MIERNEVVKTYGIKAMTTIANDLGLEKFNERSKNALCPFHSEKTPSFSFDEKTNIWHCFGCGANVDIVSHSIEYHGHSYIQAIESLCEEIGIDSDINIKDNTKRNREDEKKYKTPITKLHELSNKTISYVEKRGIKKNTLDFWRVKEVEKDFKHKEQGWVKRNALAFSSYDEYNKLTNISYRSGDKLFAQEAECKLIMYGAWHVDTTKPLIITEGQFDAMTIWQSGFKNVVSVPAGASNRSYLIENFEFLNQFPELIFWIDNDNPGRLAGNNLKEKFTHARIVIHTEYKDANDVLVNLGEQEIKRFLNEKPPLPSGIKGISNAHYDVNEPLESERIETGFSDYDKFVKDLRMQKLSVVFGRDNEGKSTFISQIVAHQLTRDTKVFLNSAELGDQGIQDWLYKQIINGEAGCFEKVNGKYQEEFKLKKGVLDAIRKYTEDKLYIIDPSDTNIISDNDVLFEQMAILATKFDVRLFILDNLQAILTSKYADINRDQSFFMERCRQFAKTYNCHVMVVAHPHKVEELKVTSETKTGNLNKDNVSGSKDITNKAHTVIAIERDFAEEKTFDMILTSLKNKQNSARRGFKYMFDSTTFMFYNDEVKTVDNNKTWKKFLAADIDKKTFNKIEITRKLDNPFD